MIRDQEIKRLEQYAKGLGLKVEYKQHQPGNASAELLSYNGVSDTIVMYLWQNKSKTQIVLDFLHELAHHLSWIHRDRKDDPALLEALIAEDARKESDPPLPKAQRKLIYQCEKRDAEFRAIIAHEVGIKVSAAKQELDRLLDVWIYEYYYRTGKFPTRELRRKKTRHFMKKLEGRK